MKKKTVYRNIALDFTFWMGNLFKNERFQIM
jgi:hypothetical protein